MKFAQGHYPGGYGSDSDAMDGGAPKADLVALIVARR